MAIVVVRYLPLSYDDYVESASALHASTVEEVAAIVNRMPADAEEHTEALPNGNIFTIRRKR